jgi:hypothetical protein
MMVDSTHQNRRPPCTLDVFFNLAEIEKDDTLQTIAGLEFI